MLVQPELFDAFLKGANQLHRAVLTLSGGRLGASFGGMPAVQLHTTGRKSGQRRSVILTAPIAEPDRLVLVASKGGDDRHPEWYHNVVADPDVELTVDGRTRPMRARPASADERAELWPVIVKKYTGYGDYQKRTDREIPLVIVEPR